MKRLVTLVIALVATILTTHAQNKSDSSVHLTFKGVPINGTLEEFVQRMKKAGFTYKATKDGMAILAGDFASYKRCTVGVLTLKPKNVVSRIGVIFPERDTWSTLSSNYFDLKEMLAEKYGEPAEVVETFQSHTPESDGSKFTLVKLDECKYYTTFKTDKGAIQLSIEHDGVMSCFVKLAYFDKINSGKEKKDALDDL